MDAATNTIPAGCLFAHMMRQDYGRLYYSFSQDGLHWQQQALNWKTSLVPEKLETGSGTEARSAYAEQAQDGIKVNSA
jgi:hypothetical protein